MSPTWPERLLDASSDLLSVHEADGTIRFANAAARRLLGLEPDDVVGTNPFRLLHPDDRDEVIGAMVRLGDEPHGSHAFLARVRHRDGSYRWLEAVARNELSDPELQGVVVSSRDVTDREAAQEALRASETRHRDMVECVPFGMGVVDGTGGVRFANSSAAALLAAQSEVAGSTVDRFVHPEDREALLQLVRRAAWDRQAPAPVECRVIREDGGQLVLRVTAVPYTWEDDPSALLVAEDVTALRHAEEQTNRQAAFLRAVLNALPAQKAVVDRHGTITEVNEAWAAFARERGGRPESTGPGVNFFEVCERVVGEDLASVRAVVAGVRAVLDGTVTGFRQDVVCMPPGQEPLYFALHAVPLQTPEGGAVLGYTDVTERKALEVEAAHRAMHDDLTGLPNRALLLDHLDHALGVRARDRGELALLFIDLDHFKLVNDGYGHEAGDQVLVELARRLRAAVRPSDTVARLAGDEFVVLCENLPFLTEAHQLAERILLSLDQPFPVGDTHVKLGASIGIAVAEDRSLTPDALLRAADQAMFEAKGRGRGQFALYDDGVHQRSLERVEQALSLRRLVEDDRVTVHYQPMVDLRDGHLTGVEALLRWRGGRITPEAAVAVALAEETGLIGEIGGRVLDQALRQAATFRRSDDSVLPLSVNLAPQQLEQALVLTVAEAAGRADYPLTSLTLELTERSVMTDLRTSVLVLRQLRDLGVQIAIDDFGAGYSSLAYLRDLPLDTLKIDREFVRALSDHPDDDRIIRAIIELGRALRLEVVAEGVERDDQRTRLIDLGCLGGQGFLFGPAQPATRIRQLAR
jgi:diguanylate cyclase (GGDEF)-like protein/PAS domain S-box-containing protein